MLKITNLSKTYKGGKRAVDRLSLEVQSGDIYGFIGPNGAGKTTTIRAVTGVLDFEEGEIEVGGYSVRREPMKAKQITAYIPDSPDIYTYLTGIQYLNFIGDIFGVARETREALIKRYGDDFELTSNLGDLVSSYSHGMRQKLAVISALLHSPRLMVLDEPFVGLDPKAAHTLKTIMAEMCADGCAIFFSTHVLDTAEKLCNKIAIIKDGSLVASGETETVRGNSSLEDVFLEITEHE